MGSCDSPTTSPDQVTTYSERLTGADLDAKLSSIKNNKKRYYCSITTLNKPNSEKRFSYQSVIYYLPDEMIDTSNNSTSVLSFVFTRQQAPKNSVYHEKYEHVVRTALCELPVIEGIEEEIKKRLSEFNENTWVGFANRSSNVNVIVSHYESDLEKTEPAFGVMSECGWYCETVWYTVTTQNGEVISIVIECDPLAWVYTCEPPENGTGLDYPPGQEPECEDPTMPCYDGPGGPENVDPCEWMLNPPLGTCEEPCELSQNHLETLFPNANTNTISKISEVIKDFGGFFGLTDEETVSHFLAQTGYESQGMTTLVENMNYSAERLVEVWPNRFSFTDPNKENPNNYANNPEKIANLVYANRLGNGPSLSGDGWNFRGRGIMQLTGRNNYQEFNSFYNNTFNENVNFVQNPDLIASNLNFAVISAMWFFKTYVLDLVNELDILQVTDLVSGSERTVDERNALLNNIENTIEC